VQSLLEALNLAMVLLVHPSPALPVDSAVITVNGGDLAIFQFHD
jgi:hypothetical protein